MSVHYEIFVSALDGSRRYKQSTFEKGTLSLRFNEVSRFELTLPTEYAREIRAPRRLEVVRNGTLLFSGPFAKISRKWSPTEDMTIVQGYDDMAFLNGRVALPVPSGPPYTSAAYDVRTGIAETVMHAYVNANAGSGAPAARRIPGLTQAADQGQGSSVTGRARFTNLVTLLQELALAGGDLRFSMLGLQFSVHTIVDKTRLIIFSNEMNNLVTFKHDLSVPDGNYGYVGGQGEDTSRTFVEGADSNSILDTWRIEYFKDRRDISDPTELNQALLNSLIEHQAKEFLYFDADISLDNVALGDQVSVYVDSGQVLTPVVRALTVNFDEVSEDVRLGVGSYGITMQTAGNARLDAIEDDVNLMATR